jgi:hypothetical protein
VGYKRVFFDDEGKELAIYTSKLHINVEIIDREDDPIISTSINLDKVDINRLIGLLETLVNEME